MGQSGEGKGGKTCPLLMGQGAGLKIASLTQGGVGSSWGIPYPHLARIALLHLIHKEQLLATSIVKVQYAPVVHAMHSGIWVHDTQPGGLQPPTMSPMWMPTIDAIHVMCNCQHPFPTTVGSKRLITTTM